MADAKSASSDVRALLIALERALNMPLSVWSDRDAHREALAVRAAEIRGVLLSATESESKFWLPSTTEVLERLAAEPVTYTVYDTQEADRG